MATLPGFVATFSPQQIPGLTAGNSYLIQNTSSTGAVCYANAPTIPAEDVEWRVLPRYEFFLIDGHDPDNPTWVKTRGPGRVASLSIGDY